jgi:glycosyltransferase involved in cell wall biosynthesis
MGISLHLFSQDWHTPDDASAIPDPRYVNTHLVRALYNPTSGFLYSPFYYQAIADLCSDKIVRIIHDHGLWLPCNHAAAKAARKFGIPLIIQPRGTLEPWALSYRAWKKRLVWRIYQQANLKSASLLVATSEQEAESIRKVGLRQPIAIIPNGLELPARKQRPFLKEPKHYALFLSRIHPKKGLMNLVDAWGNVRPEGWQMVVVGPDDGGHRAEVERAVQNAGLAGCFLFVESVEGAAKEQLYREAGFFVLPTFSENFGMAVAEALGYGVPVITTRGAPWEGLLRYKCGWWVNIGVEPLAKAIREATSLSDAERHRMGDRGRTFAEREFSLPKLAERMLAVYRWLLGLRERPDDVLLG